MTLWGHQAHYTFLCFTGVLDSNRSENTHTHTRIKTKSKILQSRPLITDSMRNLGVRAQLVGPVVTKWGPMPLALECTWAIGPP